MTGPALTPLESRVRLFIYEFVIEHERVPTLNEIAAEARLRPVEAAELLERLAHVHSAIVLSPGSANIWLADPFAALPTPYPAHTVGHTWYGMCIWDALGILAVTRRSGYAPAVCPVSGEAMELRVENGSLIREQGVAHFVVPAARWWDDIGFT